MIKVYVTRELGIPNLASNDRWWVVNDENSKLTHIGVCDIDPSLAKLLIQALGGEITYLDMKDGEFKKLMLAEGYQQ